MSNYQLCISGEVIAEEIAILYFCHGTTQYNASMISVFWQILQGDNLMMND